VVHVVHRNSELGTNLGPISHRSSDLSWCDVSPDVAPDVRTLL
jgi:hypothetical protein